MDREDNERTQKKAKSLKRKCRTMCDIVITDQYVIKYLVNVDQIPRNFLMLISIQSIASSIS